MHRYKFAIILLATFLTAWAVHRLGILDSFAGHMAEANQALYVFIAGALYSFSFTAAFAVVLFSNLTIAQEAVIPLAIIAAFGQLLMDITLLRFLKGLMDEELSVHAKRVVARVTRRPWVRLLLQFFGAIIIISPFPEEIGLTFLGISHLSYWRILLVTYILDALGAFIIINLVATII